MSFNSGIFRAATASVNFLSLGHHFIATAIWLPAKISYTFRSIGSHNKSNENNIPNINFTDAYPQSGRSLSVSPLAERFSNRIIGTFQNRF